MWFHLHGRLDLFSKGLYNLYTRPIQTIAWRWVTTALRIRQYYLSPYRSLSTYRHTTPQRNRYLLITYDYTLIKMS